MSIEEIVRDFSYHAADVANALVLNEEAKFGRTIDDEGAIRPLRDTGFRFTGTLAERPVAQPAAPRVASLPLEIHIDDMKDLGPAYIRKEKLNAVRVYEIDFAAVERRNAGYVTENITARRKREAKENSDAASN